MTRAHPHRGAWCRAAIVPQNHWRKTKLNYGVAVRVLLATYGSGGDLCHRRGGTVRTDGAMVAAGFSTLMSCE
jgi:hypothetical protein